MNCVAQKFEAQDVGRAEILHQHENKLSTLAAFIQWQEKDQTSQMDVAVRLKEDAQNNWDEARNVCHQEILLWLWKMTWISICGWEVTMLWRGNIKVRVCKLHHKTYWTVHRLQQISAIQDGFYKSQQGGVFGTVADRRQWVAVSFWYKYTQDILHIRTKATGFSADRELLMQVSEEFDWWMVSFRITTNRNWFTGKKNVVFFFKYFFRFRTKVRWNFDTVIKMPISWCCHFGSFEYEAINLNAGKPSIISIGWIPSLVPAFLSPAGVCYEHALVYAVWLYNLSVHCKLSDGIMPWGWEGVEVWTWWRKLHERKIEFIRTSKEFAPVRVLWCKFWIIKLLLFHGTSYPLSRGLTKQTSDSLKAGVYISVLPQNNSVRWSTKVHPV